MANKHKRQASATSNHQLGRNEVVTETRELEHYCMMKLITSVSQMRTDLDKLYTEAENVQSHIDYLEAGHEAQMMEFKTQISDIQAKLVQSTASGGPVRNPVREVPLYIPAKKPLCRESTAATVDELSFSDVERQALHDSGDDEITGPLNSSIEGLSTSTPMNNSTDDTSPTESSAVSAITSPRRPSHHTGHPEKLQSPFQSTCNADITIPNTWRNSKAVPSIPCPDVPGRGSIIIPEIAHLHPRRLEPARESYRQSLRNSVQQGVQTSHAELLALKNQFARLSHLAGPANTHHHRTNNDNHPGLIQELDNENSHEGIIDESPRPAVPSSKSCTKAGTMLKPISCGEPMSSFLSPQQLSLLFSPDDNDSFIQKILN